MWYPSSVSAKKAAGGAKIVESVPAATETAAVTEVAGEGAAEAQAPAAPALRGVAALPADFSLIAPEVLPKALNTLWRANTDRETPTLIQLEGRVKRVDVDALAGYVAVHSTSGTHHSIGLRRDAIPYLVAHLTKRPFAAVRVELTKGPGRFEAANPPKEEAPTDLEGVGDETLGEGGA